MQGSHGLMGICFFFHQSNASAPRRLTRRVSGSELRSFGRQMMAAEATTEANVPWVFCLWVAWFCPKNHGILLGGV